MAKRKQAKERQKRKPKSVVENLPQQDKSKARDQLGEATKPTPDFPLFVHHGTGRWCKKIRGQHKYFGPVTDKPDFGASAALARYREIGPDLHAGRTPRPTGDGLTVAELVNRFLATKETARDLGEIRKPTFENYLRAGRILAAYFGRRRLVSDLVADDFQGLRSELAKNRGPAALSLLIGEIRTMFKYGHDQGLIDSPVRFGQSLNKPSQRVMRQSRSDRGPRMFEAAELRKLLEAADQPMEAMIYLGANCAFGPADCGRLPKKAVDLKTGWVNFARPKTGIERRVPLWPQTVASIRAALTCRPQPAGDSVADRVFLTIWGNAWQDGESRSNAVASAFRALAKRAGVYRAGRGFYALRHTFRTIADETRDWPAVNLIMGHTDPTMGGLYRERIDDSRLQAVVEHVRGWVFPKRPGKKH